VCVDAPRSGPGNQQTLCRHRRPSHPLYGFHQGCERKKAKDYQYQTRKRESDGWSFHDFFPQVLLLRMKVTPLSLTGEAGETGRLVTGAAGFYAKFLKLQHEICWHHQLPLSRGLESSGDRADRV
jgi:hypothetical protein